MATNHQYREIRTFHVSHGQNRRNQNTCHSSINDRQGRADTCAFHASSIRAKTLLSHLSRYQGNFLQLAELFFPLGVELIPITWRQSHLPQMPRQAHSLVVGCTAGWCAGGGGGVCGSRPLQFWAWRTLRSKCPLVFILFWSVGSSHSVLNAWGRRGLKGKSVLWGHFSQACLAHSKGSTKSLHCAKSKSFNHDGNKTFS